ncbi:MAG: hypothetical protein HY335_11360, partial [Deinococcus sp.]|nr:hypothetical protein [Deinococcus sp.]
MKGTGFSGRTTLIKRILGGSRRCLWVLGTRRMGKTSLLRQLEYLTANDPSLGYWPLYWDLQGSRNAELLAKHLRLVLDGAAPRLAALQIHLPPDHDAITLLHHLWLQVARGSQRLLLLLDEAEELITLQQAAPEALAGLYTVVHDSEELITVLTATRELFELNELPTKTSPFLDPFLPPEHLAMLTLEETTQLIADPQLPAADIFLVTGGHPYLVQYLCSELWEGREFAEVVEATAANWVIADFFLKNHVQLTYNEQRIVQ